MPIERINTYDDPRFSPEARVQHGCYLVGGTPCEVRIVAQDTAVICGCPTSEITALIESFRFNAPHITRFLHADGTWLADLPPVIPFPVALADVQPSQFYVDEEKRAAVASFIHRAEDVIIPVIAHPAAPGRFISLDGHTRLRIAVENGWTHVRAVLDTADDVLLAFAAEAARRGIRTPADMTLLSHADYEVQWNLFCDDFMASLPDA